jgi:hypothetical protein
MWKSALTVPIQYTVPGLCSETRMNGNRPSGSGHQKDTWNSAKRSAVRKCREIIRVAIDGLSEIRAIPSSSRGNGRIIHCSWSWKPRNVFYHSDQSSYMNSSQPIYTGGMPRTPGVRALVPSAPGSSDTLISITSCGAWRMQLRSVVYTDKQQVYWVLLYLWSSSPSSSLWLDDGRRLEMVGSSR